MWFHNPQQQKTQIKRCSERSNYTHPGMKDWGTWKSAETKRWIPKRSVLCGLEKTHEFFHERALLKSLTVTVGG